ncbi:MAG: YicC family protein [Bacteroidetes bacterium]|nr:YicC family protein [Bacteroidota bacterium]MCW5895879.1 YicC family protein [Bacteroidota bacterium]
MIASMTGYGRGEAAAKGITVAVELRSVNSRFLEVSTRLPRSLSNRENEIKEIIRKKISRGKINMLAVVEHENDGDIPVRVNVSAAKGYYKLLNTMRKAVKIRESVKLEHLLQFSEVLEPLEIENTDDKEWALVSKALEQAIDSLLMMKRNEGAELGKDFRHRIGILEEKLTQIEKISVQQIPNERIRLRERIQMLLEKETIDEGRLEMELAMMADRLDVTEECVRFRSHNKFFLEALANDEAAGRKLNFLIQEMNREANTIGSKSSAAEIAHLVVNIKEEIERIREQLQNIE